MSDDRILYDEASSLLLQSRSMIADVVNEIPIEKQITNFFSGGNLVEFEMLDSLPFYQWIPLGIGAYTYKIESLQKGTLHFSVHMSENSQIDTHYHDCFEFIQLIQGQCRSTVTDEEIFTNIMVRPNVKHRVESALGCILDVLFFKSKDIASKIISSGRI